MYKENKINLYYFLIGFITLLSSLFSIFINKISPNVPVNASSSYYYNFLEGQTIDLTFSEGEEVNRSIDLSIYGLSGVDSTFLIDGNFSRYFVGTSTITESALPSTFGWLTVNVENNILTVTGSNFQSTYVESISITGLKKHVKEYILTINSGLELDNVSNVSILDVETINTTKYNDIIENYVVVPDGYKIEGFYTDSKFENKIELVDYSIAQDMSLYVKYEEITYTISFYSASTYNSVVGYNANPEEITYSVLNGLLTMPTTTGKEFFIHKGWSLNKGLYNSSSVLIDLETYEFTSDTKVYEICELSKCTVTFLDGYGDVLISKEYSYNSRINLSSLEISAPVIEGYEFMYWNVEGNNNNLTFTKSGYYWVSSDCVIYPVYKLLQNEDFNLVRIINNGTIFYDIASNNNNASKFAFFKYWITESVNHFYYYNSSDSVIVYENNLDDVFSISEIKYSFVYNEKYSTLTYGEFSEYDSRYDKFGFAVMPLYLDVMVSNVSEFETLYLQSSLLTSSLSFSNFEILEDIKVTYVDGNNSETISYGLTENIELPILTKDGYEFKGWSTYDSGSDVDVEASDIYKDVTIYAVWEKLCSQTFHFYLDDVDNEIGKFTLSNMESGATYANYLDDIKNEFSNLNFEYIKYIHMLYWTDRLSDLIFEYVDNLDDANVRDFENIYNYYVDGDGDIYVSCYYSYKLTFVYRDVVSEVYIECNLPFYYSSVKSSTFNVYCPIDKIKPVMASDGFYLAEGVNFSSSFNNEFNYDNGFMIHYHDQGACITRSDYVLMCDFPLYGGPDYLPYNIDCTEDGVILSLIYTPTRFVTLNYRTYYIDNNNKETYTVADVSCTLPFYDGANFNVYDFYNKVIFDVDLNTYYTDWQVDIPNKDFYDQIELFKFLCWNKELPTIITEDGIYSAIYDTNIDMSQIKYYDKKGNLIDTKDGVIELVNLNDICDNDSLLDVYLESFRNFALMRFGSVYNNLKDRTSFKKYYNSLCNQYVNTSYSKQNMNFSFLRICPKVKIDKVSNIQEFSCNVVSESCLYINGDYFDDNYVYVVNPFEKIYNSEDTNIYVTYGFVLGTIVDIDDSVNPGDDNLQDTLDSFNGVINNIENFFKKIWNIVVDAWTWIKWIVFGLVILVLINPIMWVLKIIYKLICGVCKAICSLFTKDKKAIRKPNKALYSKNAKRIRKK